MAMLRPLIAGITARLGAGRPAGSHTLRVLIVDDEAPVLEFVDRVLREAGFDTAVASSGAEALAIASTFGPLDLLLTDVRMPEMNGDELARHLRSAEPDLRVLYLTGYADQLFASRMVLWAGEAFLDKPCGIKALLEAVSLLLYGRTHACTHPTTTPGLIAG